MHHYGGMENLPRFVDEIYRELIEGEDGSTSDEPWAGTRDVKWLGGKLAVVLANRQIQSRVVKEVADDGGNAEPVQKLLASCDLEPLGLAIRALLLVIGDISAEYRDEQEGREAG